MKSRSEQDGTSPFKADEGNGGPGRDEAVIGPSGAGRDAAQAPASPAGPRRLGLIPSDVAQELTVRAPA